MYTKVAIVGSGFGMYGLLPAFNNIKGCKVVSICGKNSIRMQSYSRKFGLKRYADWKKMLQKEKPNAVAVSVIPSQQYEIVKFALKNRIAIFAEKPLATSVHDCIELNKLAKQKKLPNMVDFIFPEIPEWQIAKKNIESGAIGKILNVRVDWTFLSYDLTNRIKSWKTDVEQGGGALSFYFSHVFYYLEYFMGKIESLDCIMSSSKKSLNEGESIVNMILLFENGCLGNAFVDISYMGRQKHKIEFHGEEGIMILQNNSDNFADNFELIINKKKRTKKIRLYQVPNLLHNDLEDSRIKVIKPIAERFINWCNTGIAAKPDFKDGLQVQKLIEMARISNLKFHKYQ